MHNPTMATDTLTPSDHRVPWPVAFYRSAIGKKWVMAVTGIMLMGFVLAHMVGNLKVYVGEVTTPLGEVGYEIDIYGEALRSLFFPFLPEHVFLWTLRIGLIVAFILHVHASYVLTLMNRAARSIGYQGPRTYLAANYASRTMRWSGVIVLLYLAWHLADFTWGIQPFSPAGFEHGAVHDNFIASLSRPGVAILYIVANLALGLHLYHGAWSMFQSLGVNNPRFNRWRRYFAILFAGLITLANVSFPVAVLTGLVS